jgi:hypothetical protein
MVGTQNKLNSHFRQKLALQCMWNKIQIKRGKQQMKGQKRQCADKAKWEFQPANQVGAMGFNSSISQTNRWTRKHTFQRQYLWTGESSGWR